MAMIAMTNGENESMGGDPMPTRTVLKKTHEEIKSQLFSDRQNQWSKTSGSPAKELGANVERISC